MNRVLAPWLPNGLPALNAAIVRRAMLDLGICEMPPGSNRSGRIDEYNLLARAAIGSYWCASALRAWWGEAGASYPGTGAASCDVWMEWAKKTKRWSPDPIEGAAVVYGTLTDADHIGCVVRISPLMLSVEGNTSLNAYDRNGVAVDLKQVNEKRLLGFIHPEPVK
jgi:hypothetical protein